jgi:hypothetical protein
LISIELVVDVFKLTIPSVRRGEGPLYLLREQRGVVVYGFQYKEPYTL